MLFYLAAACLEYLNRFGTFKFPVDYSELDLISIDNCPSCHNSMDLFCQMQGDALK